MEGESVVRMNGHCSDFVSLFAPKVRYVSTNLSEYDAMMTWRGELEMAYLDEGDTPEVLAGYVDFLTIRLGEHPVGDLLDSLSQDAEDFAELFNGDDIGEELATDFGSVLPFNRVLIVTMVFVAEPVRGHDLGAWLVAEVIARMAGAIDTLILLYPFPAVAPTGDADELAAVAALSAYWLRAGLRPIEGHPRFLGNSTAYTHLAAARDELQAVEQVHVQVARAQIIDHEPAATSRHTLAGTTTGRIW